MPVRVRLEDIYRARAACRLPADGGRLAGDADAVRFVEEKGFVLLMPLKGLPLPSLSEADGADPWGEDFRCTDRAWAWKETLPGRKLCAYGKFVRARGTFVAWRLYPAFYAAYGPAGDLDEEYEAGRMARTDRSLVELVAAHGPVDSHDLWILAKPLFGGERHRFTAALERLQAGFFLTVAGGTLEGWSRHTWDLVERQAPAGLLDKPPAPREARAAILLQTVQNCAALPEKSLGGMLRWRPAEAQRAVEDLLAAGEITRIAVEGEKGVWVAPSPAVSLTPGCGHPLSKLG